MNALLLGAAADLAAYHKAPLMMYGEPLIGVLEAKLLGVWFKWDLSMDLFLRNRCEAGRAMAREPHGSLRKR